jgi:hypothetical protein
MTPWRARLHSFQGINQRKVLHSCHAFELLVVAVAFVCAWRLHAEFVSFDYAVSAEDKSPVSLFGKRCGSCSGNEDVEL